MNTKDILTHTASLDQAVKEKLPPTEVLNILRSLKNDVVCTEPLLRETKVGMAVNRMRMHPDKAVSQLAKDIVLKWKKDVHHKKTSEQGSAAAPPKPSGKLPGPSEPVDPSQRNKTTDRVNCQVTNDKVRDNCIGLVYDGLCFESDTPSQEILTLAVAIEKAVYANFKRKTEQPYRRRIQSLYLNLKDKKNPHLRSSVVSGEISPERLSTMESHEMASAERKKEDEKIQQENMRSAMGAKAEKSISDQLTCGKCKGKKVSYSQAQTRSADEPMTTFCECELCGKRWKFS